ncbi:MAG: hypothetical protein JKY59_09880 [Emcibacter sp.]|nr:hypothetical protein [Emcibacter sp.]
MNNIADDLPLFSAIQAKVVRGDCDDNSSAVKLEKESSAINPDELTPREAMDVLYKLKKLQQDG